MVLLLDGVLFRDLLPSDYVTGITRSSLSSRLSYYVPRALLEEALYRLFVVSSLAAVLTRLLPVALAYWMAIVVAQLINVVVSLPFPMGLPMMAYTALRFYCPGLVWGYVYWRRGFFGSASAHAGAHLILQPLLGVALA
jgi:hypothetical protein